MNLVIFNMANISDWESGVVNRNFFIVQELLRRKEFNKVLLVDFLAVQGIKKVFGKRRTYQYAKELFSKKGDMHIGPFHRVYKGVPERFTDVQVSEVYTYKGLGVFSSQKKQIDQIQSVMNELGFAENDTIVWNYNPFLPDVFSLKSTLSIFDAVDNWAVHASYTKEANLLMNNYDAIGTSADIIFAVSDGHKAMFKNSHWIPNGVDVENFHREDLKEPEDLANIKKPIIGYVGTIQERVDLEMVEQICKDHSDKSVVFIGPVWDGVKEQVDALQSRTKNIYFLGRRDFRQIPDYLASVDVAIIPHKIDSFIKSTNPMKMWDYLAAGKAIVTTPGAGTEMFEDLLYIELETPAFSKAITKAMQEDSEELIKKRKEAVQVHSWKSRVSDMMTIISKHS